MYARGMTPRAPRGALRDRRVAGPDLDGDGRRASRHAGGMGRRAALETVTEWQGRPLDACYPLVFFDAIRVKIRDEGFVQNKAVYIALGILPGYCGSQGGDRKSTRLNSSH